MWRNGSGKKIDSFSDSLVSEVKKELGFSGIKIIVGCDSQVVKNKIVFVTVVIVVHIGRGANFFYKKECESKEGKLAILENRLFEETCRAVETAKQVDGIVVDYDLCVDEIHSDINPDKKYKSNRIAAACIGFIMSNGYKPVIKPNAFGASGVADSKTRG